VAPRIVRGMQRGQAEGLPLGRAAPPEAVLTGMIEAWARKRRKSTRGRAELLIKPPSLGQCGDQGEMVAR
jgi:hypothetical protein